MIRPRPTVRVRLTLLYTGLFLACGTVLVGVTYALVAAGMQDKPPPGAEDTVAPEQFVQSCKQTMNEPNVDPGLYAKCQNAFNEGVDTGARTQRDVVLDNLMRYSVTTLGVCTALAAVAGWIVAGRVLRPVHRLTAAARSASEHNLSARVGLDGPRDELRELADTFDEMLARLEVTFEGQRRFIANASHEVRTPLTVIRTVVDVVLAKPAPTREELVRMGRDVRAAVDHAEALIEALLTLARTERGLAVREPVDLATVAEDAVDTVDPADRTVGLELTSAPTTGDPILLERLAANLVDNAVRYNVPGGHVQVATSTVNGHVTLTVSNTGTTVADGAVAGLFEPFSRLHDRTGVDGSGLGLAIVASIAAAHGGDVLARSNPSGGLHIAVTLPRGPS